MKENNTKPVQVVLTYNANNSVKNSDHVKIITGHQQKEHSRFIKLDDNDKLMRRYSFDDNGGGYRGL